VIIYHLLSSGTAYAQLEGGERVRLSAGDLVTFPHGHSHLLGGGPGSAAIDGAAALRDWLGQGLDLRRLGGGGAPATFICGFMVCDPQLSQAFLGGLPPLIKVNIRDDPSGQWLENSLKFSVLEAEHRRAGGDALLTKLSEALFGETLRRYVRMLPEDEVGWLAGTRDALVGKALTLLHGRHAHPWTVAELARETGLSRTVLAERFKHFLGQSPKAYLTRWRLLVGARALTTTSHSVAQIAADVGYESEAAFNRAFKHEYNLPPARYWRDKAAQPAGRDAVSTPGRSRPPTPPR
jgi:AraC-like DNA-binding protein